MTVEILSAIPLGKQIGTDGATWLDRELVVDHPTATRNAGFGREVREALIIRRQWLVGQELAREEESRLIFRRDLLSVLRRRELARVGTQPSGKMGLSYAEPRQGERVDGIYRRRLDLAIGRFALIEKSREFTLVPWRSCSPGPGNSGAILYSASHGRGRSSRQFCGAPGRVQGTQTMPRIYVVYGAECWSLVRLAILPQQNPRCADW